jgi:hypothetical protein
MPSINPKINPKEDKYRYITHVRLFAELDATIQHHPGANTVAVHRPIGFFDGNADRLDNKDLIEGYFYTPEEEVRADKPAVARRVESIAELFKDPTVNTVFVPIQITHLTHLSKEGTDDRGQLLRSDSADHYEAFVFYRESSESGPVCYRVDVPGDGYCGGHVVSAWNQIVKNGFPGYVRNHLPLSGDEKLTEQQAMERRGFTQVVPMDESNPNATALTSAGFRLATQDHLNRLAASADPVRSIDAEAIVSEMIAKLQEPTKANRLSLAPEVRAEADETVNHFVVDSVLAGNVTNEVYQEQLTRYNWPSKTPEEKIARLVALNIANLPSLIEAALSKALGEQRSFHDQARFFSEDRRRRSGSSGSVKTPVDQDAFAPA